MMWEVARSGTQIIIALMITMTLMASCLEIMHASALHFLLDGGSQKCFKEELPKETTVIGTFASEILDTHTNTWKESPTVKIHISAEYEGANHKLVDQKGQPKGRFTFTTSDSGDHLICLSASGHGWLDASSKTKVYLDLMFGDVTHDMVSGKKAAVEDLAQRVKDLTGRVDAILREQRYQRTREAEFRDTSEAINSKVVNWTIAQVVVLVITGAWQMTHLKNFFVSKKLV